MSDDEDDQEDKDLEADWLEAGRLARARLAMYNRSEYGTRFEDDRWRKAIKLAEVGDSSELIIAITVLPMTSWSRRALIKLFRGYNLTKKSGGQTKPLSEQFRMNYEQATDFVRLRRAKLEQAEASGRRQEIAQHSRRVSKALLDAANKAGIDDVEKLARFLRGSHGKRLPEWASYEEPS